MVVLGSAHNNIGGGGAGPQLLGKKYHFMILLLFHPEASKMCKNTKKLLIYLRVVKDRVSSSLSLQTLDNFGGIIGKIFNFGTDQLFFRNRGF